MDKRTVLSLFFALVSIIVCAQDDGSELRHIQIFQDVLNSQPDVDINERNNRGLSPLINEAHHGHAEAVRFLVAQGANIVATDTDGNTAEDYARAYGHDALAEELRLMRLDLGEEELVDYTHANLVRLALLSKMIPDVDHPYTYANRTLLIVEAQHGHIHAVETLLKLGADPSVQDDYGNRARDYAGDDQRIIDALERAEENPARTTHGQYAF